MALTRSAAAQAKADEASNVAVPRVTVKTPKKQADSKKNNATKKRNSRQSTSGEDAPPVFDLRKVRPEPEEDIGLYVQAVAPQEYRERWRKVKGLPSGDIQPLGRSNKVTPEAEKETKE